MPLTDRQISLAKTDGTDLFLSDGKGLYLRVRISGNKVWLYRFKNADGKTQWFEIGTYPPLSLVEARSHTSALNVKRRNGIDPVEEKRQERIKVKAEQAEAASLEQARITEAEAIKARISVRGLFDQWATTELCKRKDGGKEIRRMFEKDVLPAIGTLAVEDVKKGHVAAMTNAILARGVDRMAKLIFALVRQMFRYAQDCDIIEADPTATIRKHKIGGKDTERDRVLSDEEIRELRDKVPAANLMQSSEAAVWIALSTLCRIGELLNARWADVDFERAVWIIPAGNSKNGKAHTIYMSDFALLHFHSLYKVNGSGEWCYPNRDGTGAVCSKTVTKQIGDRQRLEAMTNRAKATGALRLSGGRWTMHDLRRTGATMMSALGVLPDIIERCLNHTEENKVKRIYQRHGYEAEQREAWRLLGERLELLLRDDAGNVAMLRNTA